MVDAASLKLLVSIFYLFLLLFVPDRYKTELFRVFDFGVYACKNDLIIRAYVAAVCPAAVDDGFITDVVLHPGNKENLAFVPSAELFKVQVSSVRRYYRTRFEVQCL